MVFRFLVAFITLIAFTIDSQYAPGGSKITIDVETFLNLLFSFLFTCSWVVFWDLTVKSKKLSRTINTVFFGLMAVIYYYEFNTGGRLDVSVIFDNWRGSTSLDGLRITGRLLYDNFVAANFVIAGIIAGLVYLTYKEKESKTYQFVTKYRYYYVLLPFLLLVVLVIGFNSSYEYYTGLARGVLDRVYSRPHKLQKLIDQVKTEKQGTYIETSFQYKKKPNIILLFIESFSADFVNKFSDKNVEYLPNFNKLIEQGIYFEKHYSVSVQTSRGHFAALCGKIPIYRGLESQNFVNDDFDCLPKYMKNAGYSTHFSKAYGNLDFDNEKNFYISQGYDQVPQLSFTCDKETKVPCWNWGIQDDEYYRRILDYAKKLKDQPFFLTLTTVSSHMPFVGVPENLVVHYPKPKSRYENYVNTLTIVDLSIPVIVDGIKNSEFSDNTVLIITGDHSFPMGQHDNFHNENYAFDENFKVPFLILDFRKKEKVNQKITIPTSHLNLPSTILDYAQFTGETSFMGSSLFKAGDQPIYLVQPYSGGLLGSIRWPWKYLFEIRNRREVVFNLEEDPQELKKLKISDVPESILGQLQVDVARIIYNNEKVRKNK